MLKRRFGVAVLLAALTMPTLAFAEGTDHAAWKALVESTFATADADHDGALSAEEFATFKQLMQQNRESRMFQRADADGNGAVTLQELEAMPHHRRGGGCQH